MAIDPAPLSTNRFRSKSFWTILALAIALAASLCLNGLFVYDMKAVDEWRSVVGIQNTQYRTFRYVAVREHLRDGDIDKAGSLLDAMIKGEKSLLRMQQDPERYSAAVNRAAAATLARIEADQEHGALPKSVERNAHVHE